VRQTSNLTSDKVMSVDVTRVNEERELKYMRVAAHGTAWLCLHERCPLAELGVVGAVGQSLVRE